MDLNTERVVGYNNQLKQAVAGMNLGINNYTNLGAKEVGVAHMEGETPKTIRPNDFPSAWAVALQSERDKTDPAPVAQQQPSRSEKNVPTPAGEANAHETNKNWLIAAEGLGAFAFSRVVL